MLLEHREMPKFWGLLGLDLKHAADVLWVRGATNSASITGDIFAERELAPREDTLAQAYGFMTTASLLLGLAFENLIKGIVVAREPTLIKDGAVTGRLVTHKVADLARDESLLTSDGEYRQLKILEQYVLWLGRYPLPREKQSYHDLIGLEPGDDPLELDKALLDTLWDHLVHHPDMRWDP